MNLNNIVLKLVEEVAASATTTASIDGRPEVLGKKKKKKIKAESDGTAFGCDYFDCNFDDFNKALPGRKKNQKFKTFLNSNTELTNKVRQFRKENPKKDLLLRSTRDGSFIYANRPKT